jgi:hypothetical protein
MSIVNNGQSETGEKLIAGICFSHARLYSALRG